MACIGNVNIFICEYYNILAKFQWDVGCKCSGYLWNNVKEVPEINNAIKKNVFI